MQIFASATLALVVNASVKQDNDKNKRDIAEQTQIYGYKPIAIYQDPIVGAAAVVQQQGILPNTQKPIISITYPPQIKSSSETVEGTKVNPQIIYGYPSHETSIQNPLPTLPQVRHPAPQQIIYNPLQVTPAPINLYHNYHQPNIQPITSIQHQMPINHLQSHVSNPSTFTLSNIPKYVIPRPKAIQFTNVLHPNVPQSIIHTNPLSAAYQKPFQPAPINTASYNILPKQATKLPLLPIIPNTYSLQQTHAPEPWKPMAVPPKPQKIENTKEEKPVVEEAEEDKEEINEEYNNDNSNNNSGERYEEAEEEEEDYDNRKPYHSERYHYDDDNDDESHERYEEADDEDEVNHRGSSQHYRKKPYKYHTNEYKPYKKYEVEDNFRYKSKKDYEAKTKEDAPHKNYYKSYDDREPRTSYKFKKSIKMNGFRSKMDDNYEDDQSTDIPTVHNKKVVQEKWFVSKTHDMME